MTALQFRSNYGVELWYKQGMKIEYFSSKLFLFNCLKMLKKPFY